jgi:hypothetical protein
MPNTTAVRTAQVGAAPFFAGKNKIINGDFRVWQRGTSFSGLGDGAYFADRFAIAWSAGGASNTASQQTFTPGTAPVSGYEGQYFARVAATSGGASTVLGISQKVEDVRTLAGQAFTFSFWAKADSARTITSYMIQNFGSGGSASVTNTTTYALTTSWARYTYTATMPSVSGKTIGAGSYFYIDFELAAGQATGSPTLDTWGWQLEAGSVATAFQTATGTLQGELAACQRYYQTLDEGSMCGRVETTSQATLVTTLPVAMRTQPSATLLTGTNALLVPSVAFYSPTAIGTLSGTSGRAVRISFTGASGMTAGNVIVVSAQIAALSAEL